MKKDKKSIDMYETPEAPWTRAMVAVLFADISKSTQLFEKHGDVRALQLVEQAISILTRLTVQNKGTLIKTIGDEIMCTFPDAQCACTAAVEMPNAIAEDPELSKVGMQIRVGIHYGEVILENNDVYGDAVNTAARMVELAKANQIITTQSTIDLLPPILQASTRSLGHSKVRGKEQPIAIGELLWQSDPGNMTYVAADLWRIINQMAQPKLTLRFGDQEFVLEPNSRPFTLGRDSDNDLVVKNHNVSRTHASIEFNQSYFVLTDRSTNGTYLQIGTDKVFLHRDRITLNLEGVISLGQEVSEGSANLIRFRCDK